MADLTNEEKFLLKQLVTGPLDDLDRIPDRVLVNTGLAKRVGVGMLEITGDGRKFLWDDAR